MKDMMAISAYDFQNTSPGRIDGKNSGAVVEFVSRVFVVTLSAGLQYFVAQTFTTHQHHILTKTGRLFGSPFRLSSISTILSLLLSQPAIPPIVGYHACRHEVSHPSQFPDHNCFCIAIQ